MRESKPKKEKSHAERLSQFWTDPEMAQRIVDWAALPEGARVLEPSAGAGNIVRCFPAHCQVTAVELDPAVAQGLPGLHPHLDVVVGDLLKAWPEATTQLFDVAVMNPPYEDGADGTHVVEALRLCHRVVCFVRANFCWGVARYHGIFRWAKVTRRVILVRRPPFCGPADAGHTAMHDYQILELARRDWERGARDADEVKEEIWL